MIKRLLLYFTLWKVCEFGIAFLAMQVVPLQKQAWIGYYFNIAPHPLFWMWSNFDGVNYLYIAREGYGYPNFAFFPLLPLLISLVNKILGLQQYLYIGLIISNAALFAGLIFLYKIVRLDYKTHVAKHAVLLLLIFPFSYYYGAVYTDALFFVLATLSFYFARKKQWVLAGIVGYFASLARLIGVILCVVLVVEWIIQQKRKQQLKPMILAFVKDKAYFLFLIPLGLVTYAAYLQVYHHDFLLFQKAMENWNQESFVLPIQVLYRYIKILIFSEKNFTYMVAFVELTAFVSYLALAIYTLRRVRVSYGLFMLIVLLVPAFTGTFQSMPRYGLHTFPLFLSLALLLNNKKIFYSLVFIFLVLHIIFSSLYLRGFFIA